MTDLPAFPVPSSDVVAGVIGFPVAHSQSPRIHNAWLQLRGIHGRYEAIAVAPTQLEGFLRSLPGTSLRGVNVTVPHKEETLKYMDVLDDTAQKAGAVNTVIVRQDGKLEGRNTDIYGFITNLEFGAGRHWKKKKPALIVGAGGAARAVIVALADVGCHHIRITNRTLDRARDLLADMKPRLPHAELEIVAWEDREDVLDDAGLLVNTTTQGMVGNPALDINIKRLPEEAVVTDLVYTPIDTPLLNEAKRRGHPVVDGLGMLLHQAVPAFDFWFGLRPAVTDDLRKRVVDALQRDLQNVA